MYQTLFWRLPFPATAFLCLGVDPDDIMLSVLTSLNKARVWLFYLSNMISDPLLPWTFKDKLKNDYKKFLFAIVSKIILFG